MKWEGVMPAVTTKFTDDDKLDLDLFSTNILAQLDAGVSAIVLGGTLGEASTLTLEEKNILTKKTIELTAGRIPVVVNVAEQSTKDAIGTARSAEENGASGLMVLPPMRYKSCDVETV